jgi:hypothetical protein
MLKWIVLVVLFFSLTGSSIGDYCTCYCPDIYTYAGTTYPSSCTNSTCQNDCYNTYAGLICISLPTTYGLVRDGKLNFYTSIHFFRICTQSGTISGLTGDIGSVVKLGVGIIIAIAIGGLAGIALLIGIIIALICLCKKRPVQMVTIQPQQQAMGQVGMYNGFGQPQQQAMSQAGMYNGLGQPQVAGFQNYQPGASMNYGNP